MQPVGYKPYIPEFAHNNKADETNECPMCRDELPEKDFVYHEDPVILEGDKKYKEGDGFKHPMCLPCAKIIALTSKLCPFCRVPIKPDSVLPWKDRCVNELQNIGKDALMGAAIGVTEVFCAIVGGGLGFKVGAMAGTAVAKGIGTGVGIALGAGVGATVMLFSVPPEKREAVFATGMFIGATGAAAMLIGGFGTVPSFNAAVKAVGFTGLMGASLLGSGLAAAGGAGIVSFFQRRFTLL